MDRVKCIVLVPTRRNDGSAVPVAELESILNEFVERFGAYTVAGEVEGAWRSSAGAVFRDRNTQVWIAIDPSELPALRQLIEKIGRQLGQKAMYLEVSQGTVEIVPIGRRPNGRARGGRRKKT